MSGRGHFEAIYFLDNSALRNYQPNGVQSLPLAETPNGHAMKQVGAIISILPHILYELETQLYE